MCLRASAFAVAGRQDRGVATDPGKGVRGRGRALAVSPVAPAAFAYFVYFTAVGAAWPYLPVYYQALGFDLRMIGALTALAAATQLVSAPIWGALNDRFAAGRWVLFIAPSLAAAAALALAWAQVLPAVVASVIALYVGLSGIAPMLDARTLSILGADRMRYGRVRAWGSASFVLAAWLVGILLDRTGPAGLFYVYVPALVLTALATLPIAPRTLVHSASMFRGGQTLLRQRDLALFLVAALLVWTALAAANSFYSLYIVSVGGSAETVGLAWALGSAVEVPFMWSQPALAKRFGVSRLIVAGAAVFALRAALAALLATPATLVAITVTEGMAFGLFYAGGVTYVARHAPPKLGATAQGLFSAMIGLAVVVGSTAGGIVAQAATIRGLYFVCAAGSVLGSVAVWYAVRGDARAEAEPEPGGAGPSSPG